MKKDKIIITLILLSTLTASLQIQEPEKGAKLSGVSQIQIKVNETDFDRLELFWGTSSTGWSQLNSVEINSTDKTIYNLLFNASELPESDEILIRTDGVQCRSPSLCWVSETMLRKITVDNTPPEVRSSWLIVKGLGGKNHVRAELSIIDTMTRVEGTEPSTIRKNDSRHLINLDSDFNSSTIKFTDEAGNQGSYTLEYALTDNRLNFKSGDEENQVYVKEDMLENPGKEDLYYSISHSPLPNADKVIEGPRFTGRLDSKNTKALKSQWKGDWIKESGGEWRQNQEKVSTPEEVHFKKEMVLNASEDLPASAHFTYQPEPGAIDACEEVEIEPMNISIQANETLRLTVEAKADCIGDLDLSEWNRRKEGRKIFAEASYVNVSNFFTEDLEIRYSLKEKPSGLECGDEEDECSLTVNTLSGEDTDVNFTVVGYEEQIEGSLKSDENTFVKGTGFLSGVLDNEVSLQVVAGALTLVIVLAVFYKLKH